jgi:hypothetical protein
MGVAVVQLDVADVGHTHCGPTAGVTGYLTTAATGPIRVLWKESGTGSKLGMVLMQEVGDSTLTTGNVGDSGAQDSTTTVLRFNEATGSKITKGATAGDPDVHTLLAASASQMGAVTTTTQAFAGAKTFNTSVGLADSGNGYLTMDDWGDYNGNYFVGLNCNNVSTLLFDNVTGRVMLVGIGGATKYAVMDSGFNILSGGTATTGGLTFAGGLYISGTLSVSAGDVSGLAAVATSGDYADITGGPPATTTVAASYDSGTKDLTITVNGVSTTVNLT